TGALVAIIVHIGCSLGSGLQLGGEEPEDLVPGVHRLSRPVPRCVVVHEAVPGAVVPVELVRLARLAQRLLVLVDLFRARALVLVAEDAEQGCVEVRRVLDGRDRASRGRGLGRGDDATAPEIDDGVEAWRPRGDEHRVPPAGTGAQDADLAVVAGP